MTSTKVDVEYKLTDTQGNPQIVIQRLIWPNRCACCGAPAPKTAYNVEIPIVTSTSSSTTRFSRLTWAVPYCEACITHDKENKKRSENIKSMLQLIGLWAVVALIGVAVLGGKWPVILAVIVLGSAAIAALMWRHAFKSIPRTPTCKSYTGPLYASAKSYGRSSVRMYFADSAYGEDFAALNRLNADVDPLNSRDKAVSEAAQASLVKQRKVNLKILAFLTLVDAALAIYKVHLAQGQDLRGIYLFDKFFLIFMIVLTVICFLGLVYSASSLGPKGNWHALWYAALMIVPVGVLIIGAGNNSPQDALNFEVAPLVQRFYHQDVPHAYTTDQTPSLPSVIFDGQMTLDASGTPALNGQQVSSLQSPWRSNSANDLRLLDAYMKGQTSGAVRSIVVVGRVWYATGRNIALDVGSVPEFRQKAYLFVVDVPSWQVVKIVGPFIGGEAKLPSRGPGGEIIQLTELRGPDVSNSAVDAAIKQIGFNQ